MLLILRAGVSPVLWLLEKHYVPFWSNTPLFVYCMSKKSGLEQMERMPKEQLFYKANTLSRFSMKERINLVLDISLCSSVYFFTFVTIQRSRFILLIYQRRVILDVYLSVAVAVCSTGKDVYVFCVWTWEVVVGLLQMDMMESVRYTNGQSDEVVWERESEEHCMCALEVLAVAITEPNTQLEKLFYDVNKWSIVKHLSLCSGVKEYLLILLTFVLIAAFFFHNFVFFILLLCVCVCLYFTHCTQ